MVNGISPSRLTEIGPALIGSLPNYPGSCWQASTSSHSVAADSTWHWPDASLEHLAIDLANSGLSHVRQHRAAQVSGFSLQRYHQRYHLRLFLINDMIFRWAQRRRRRKRRVAASSRIQAITLSGSPVMSNNHLMTNSSKTPHSHSHDCVHVDSIEADNACGSWRILHDATSREVSSVQHSGLPPGSSGVASPLTLHRVRLCGQMSTCQVSTVLHIALVSTRDRAGHPIAYYDRLHLKHDVPVNVHRCPHFRLCQFAALKTFHKSLRAECEP
ncbi:hypothetical protein F5Y12DRAFT_800840 [Xylaria sp. FL1777]|nr:hypothetical protein F5Y12DRAFT_800840 [Xylaria sp. FL1777]